MVQMITFSLRWKGIFAMMRERSIAGFCSWCGEERRGNLSGVLGGNGE